MFGKCYFCCFNQRLDKWPAFVDSPRTKRSREKIREARAQSWSMPPVHPHSALAVSTLQIWINCSIFTSISNFYIFTESFNSKYNITAHSIVSSSLFRSTQLNNCITQLLTLDHIQEVMIQFLFFLPHPWITCKFLKVDTGLIFWTNLDQLQHFIPVNSQQHPINCIRKLPSF